MTSTLTQPLPVSSKMYETDGLDSGLRLRALSMLRNWGRVVAHRQGINDGILDASSPLWPQGLISGERNAKTTTGDHLPVAAQAYLDIEVLLKQESPRLRPLLVHLFVNNNELGSYRDAQSGAMIEARVGRRRDGRATVRKRNGRDLGRFIRIVAGTIQDEDGQR